MALTYGFYSSLNHDRTYNAEQMSEIFNGIINDGIFQNIGTYMAVEENSSDINKINIGIGRAWFNGTWSLNDTLYPMEMPDAPMVSGFSRIDAIVLKVNKDQSARMNTFECIKGTETSDTPSKPSLVDTDYIFYHPLAYITRTYRDNGVKQSVIENVVGTSTTPFVTGVLETAELDDLLLQWQAQWTEWLDNKKTIGDAAWTELITTYTENWANWFQSETTINETEWSNWFDSIRGQLSEDAATHLQQQIDYFSYVYVQDNVLYLPNTMASVSTDGTLVLGTFNGGQS